MKRKPYNRRRTDVEAANVIAAAVAAIGMFSAASAADISPVAFANPARMYAPYVW